MKAIFTCFFSKNFTILNEGSTLVLWLGPLYYMSGRINGGD